MSDFHQNLTGRSNYQPDPTDSQTQDQNLADDLLKNTVNPDPRVSKVITDHFWDMDSQTPESQDTIFINWLNRVIDDASQPDVMINADNLYHLQLKPLVLAAQKALLENWKEFFHDLAKPQTYVDFEAWADEAIAALERQQLGKDKNV